MRSMSGYPEAHRQVQSDFKSGPQTSRDNCAENYIERR